MSQLTISPARALAALFTLFAGIAFADTESRWKGSSQIEFSGTSTLHEWGGKVKAQPFDAEVSLDAEGHARAVKAEVMVKAAEMDTAEPKRDENMHKDMKVSSHPLITARMDQAFTKPAADGSPVSRLPFTLTLLGKPHQVEGRVSHWSAKGDTVTFDLDFELSLKACGITVPSVLLVISVGDTIKVHAPVKLVRTGR